MQMYLLLVQVCRLLFNFSTRGDSVDRDEFYIIRYVVWPGWLATLSTQLTGGNYNYRSRDQESWLTSWLTDAGNSTTNHNSLTFSPKILFNIAFIKLSFGMLKTVYSISTKGSTYLGIWKTRTFPFVNQIIRSAFISSTVSRSTVKVVIEPQN